MKQTNPRIARFLALSALTLAVPLSALAQQSAPATGDLPMDHHMHHGQQSHHGMDGEDMGNHMFMLRGLDLSAAQKEQVKALIEAQRQPMQDKFQATRAARGALRDLVFSGKYTPDAAKKLAGDISSKETEQILFMAEQGNKLVQILTPEQRTKMQERMKSGQEHFRH